MAVFTGHKAYTLRLIDPKSDINFETLNDLNYLKVCGPKLFIAIQQLHIETRFYSVTFIA